MTAPGDALSAPADALRAWGGGHPVVVFLTGHLPPLRNEGALPPGLYVDAERAPWVAVKGELRISLARLYSVRDGHRTLVGQAHATERLRATGIPERHLRLYLHRPDVFLTEEVASVDAWWLAVLERHYELGGAPLDLADAAPAPL